MLNGERHCVFSSHSAMNVNISSSYSDGANHDQLNAGSLPFGKMSQHKICVNELITSRNQHNHTLIVFKPFFPMKYIQHIMAFKKNVSARFLSNIMNNYRLL